MTANSSSAPAGPPEIEARATRSTATGVPRMEGGTGGGRPAPQSQARSPRCGIGKNSSTASATGIQGRPGAGSAQKIGKPRRSTSPGRSKPLASRFPYHRSGGTALRVKLVVGYDGRKSATAPDAEFIRGQHIAIVGGERPKRRPLKTSPASFRRWTAHARWGHNLRIAFYAQFLHRHARSAGHGGRMAAATQLGISSGRPALAGNFLFSIEDLDKTVSVLSGGERLALCLARLLLDAPTSFCSTGLPTTSTWNGSGGRSRPHSGMERNCVLRDPRPDLRGPTRRRILEVGGGADPPLSGTFEEYVWAASQVSSLRPGYRRALSQSRHPRRECRPQGTLRAAQAPAQQGKQARKGIRGTRRAQTATPFDLRGQSVRRRTRPRRLHPHHPHRHTEGEWMKTLERSKSGIGMMVKRRPAPLFTSPRKRGHPRRIK